MRNTLLLYGKEMLEMSRSYKLLWVPVVFILLGVMQPVMMYYLPELLAASGDLPAELASTLAVPSAPEVMAQVLNQYNTIGIRITSYNVCYTKLLRRNHPPAIYGGNAEE